MRLNRVQICIFLLAVWQSPYVWCADIHVAKSGNDRNVGSRPRPVMTINRGLELARRPGDRVIVHEGVYSPLRSIIVRFPGTDKASIELLSADGEVAIVDGSNTPNDTDLIYVGTHHVRVKGLTIRNAKRNGIAIYGPGSRVHHVEVVDNTIHDCDLSGIYAGCKTLDDPVRDILMEANDIHDVSLRNLKERKNSWSFGMGVGLSKNVTIRKNTVHNTHGESVGLYLSRDGHVEGNTVSDGYSVNIYLDNTTGTTVTRNFVFNTGKRTFNRFDQPPSGIQIANERYGGLSNPSSGNIITNNILVANRNAFYYGSYQNGGGLRDTVFAHNTCYGSTGPLLQIDNDNHKNAVFTNNIFFQTGRSKITAVIGPTTGLTFRSNLWFGGGQPRPAVRSESDVATDPQFRNPKALNSEGYQLQATSPAVGAATGKPFVKVGFDGRQRQVVSLGAW